MDGGTIYYARAVKKTQMFIKSTLCQSMTFALSLTNGQNKLLTNTLAYLPGTKSFRTWTSSANLMKDCIFVLDIEAKIGNDAVRGLASLSGLAKNLLVRTGVVLQ